MDTSKPGQATMLANAREIAKLSRAASAFRQLRHLGFQRVYLSEDLEFLSDGPSAFHELGYCISGEILLLVGQGFERVETFTVKGKDLFFIPAGTTYSIHNDGDLPSSVLLSTARDGIDSPDLPLGEGGRVVVLDDGDKARSWQADSSVDRDESCGAYEVVFKDNGRRREQPKLVSEIFDRRIVAREFGIPESHIPDLNFSLFDPLVIRPIAEDELGYAEGYE